MKVRIAAITLFTAATCFAATAAAQSSATAGVATAQSKSKAEPGLAGRAVVGYLATNSGTGIQPIVGVTGASRVGEEIDFGLALGAAAVAPAGGYGIGVAAETGEVMVLDLAPERVTAVLDAPPNPNRILFGPSGSVTALYYRAGAQLNVVRDLLGSPTVDEGLTISGPGVVAAVAIADSGDVALAAFSSEDGATVYSFSDSGAQFVTQANQVVDLRFSPNSHNALITDAGAAEVILVTNVGESSGVRVVADAESGLTSPITAASIDGETAYVLSANGIAKLDLATGAAKSVDCRCQPSGLDAVGRDSRFHLTGNQPGVIALLDGSGDEDAIVLVPARPAAPLTVTNRRSPARSRSR